MKIPVADNPEHVDNLSSIPLLEAQGFRGNDNCLATSIFEYGFAFRKMENETIFIYGIRNDTGDYCRFDRCSLSNDLDVRTEWEWVDFEMLMNTLGANLNDWFSLALEQKVFDLYNYYGSMEIFGESYWEGFKIIEHEEN